MTVAAPAFRRGLSVRARTTLVAAVVVIVAMVGGAMLLAQTLDDALIRDGDRAAVARARDVAVLASEEALPRELFVSPDEDFVQVVDAEGKLSSGTEGRSNGPALTSFAPAEGGPEVRAVERLPDGAEFEDYRVAALEVETPDGVVTVYAGYAVESIAETKAAVNMALWRGIPLLVLVLVITTWLLVGRALRPVSAIREQVDDISLGALDRRVPVSGTKDEIHHLAVTMNAMLDRLESASNRQRHFVADASHELQSPIAALRAQLEVAIAHPQATDWSETARDLLDDTDRMERLVRDLLFLARADSGVNSPDLGHEVDLDDIVLEEAARLRPRLATVTVDTSLVSAAPLIASPEALTRLVRNVLENAVRHAANRVAVELSAATAETRLVVCDDGPGVPAEERERVFERFVQLDAGRDRTDVGTGLGLSISREIVRSQGGVIGFDEATDGARLVVVWPTSVRRADTRD